ncbi:MAG TPA: hypothetical protein VN578_00610 [Candidatus Binatia bacterium]|nr:hypothetical protein [Candidatus Binatia bacterium]
MGEFKFACPNCGQHITAAASASGTKLECPTCFRKIIVPQAPTDGDSKFILSAAQADKPRPLPTATLFDSGVLTPRRHSIVPAVLLVVCLLGVGGAVFLLRGKLFGPAKSTTQVTNDLAAKPAVPLVTHPVPTNTSWTLDLTNAIVPDEVAAGSIHGGGFLCERASLQGGNLGLRQGRTSQDLRINIVFFAKLGEELSGKTLEVTPERVPPLPKVTLHWTDDRNKGVNQNIPNGYALKIAFGPAANGRITGKLFIALPDESKSFVAGTFDAEIRKPPPPKPPKPKTK